MEARESRRGREEKEEDKVEAGKQDSLRPDSVLVNRNQVIVNRSDLESSEQVNANLHVLARKVFVDVRHLIRHLRHVR